MANTFVIADTHFDHKNIISFEHKYRGHFKDVKEMNEAIVDNWNKIVKPEDTVFHLGDVVFGHDLSIVKRLNGHKNLIFGNHDNHFPIQKFIDNGFENFYGMYRLDRKYFLTHCPMHDDEMMMYPSMKNIHGHIHSRLVLTKHLKPDTRYINVGVELTNFKPVNMEEIEKYQRKLFEDTDKVSRAVNKFKDDYERCSNV